MWISHMSLMGARHLVVLGSSILGIWVYIFCPAIIYRSSKVVEKDAENVQAIFACRNKVTDFS